MSGNEKLEQKIDDTNSKMDKLIETMTTFVAFQSRAEERHEYTTKAQNKLEARVDKLWDMVHKNSLIVNAAVAVVTAIVIWQLKSYFGG